MASDPLAALDTIPGVLSRRVNADPERVEKGLAQLVLTVVDLSVSLLGVLAVLPAVLMLAERRAVRTPAPQARPAREPAVPV